MTPAQLAKNGQKVTPGAFGANCELANGSDAAHDINIGVGSCGDSTGTYQMTLASTLVKQIDAGWAQGSAAGGLFSGSVATGTWYHVFVIRNDTTGAIDGGFDTSVTAANRPSGWTAYCRVGAVLTDGSSNISLFSQKMDQVLWLVPVFDVNTGGIGTTAVLVTVSVPIGLQVVPLVGGYSFKTAEPPGLYWSSLDVTDVVAATGNFTTQAAVAGAGQPGVVISGPSLRTDTSAQIRTRSDTAGTTQWLWTYGWNDPRGKVAA